MDRDTAIRSPTASHGNVGYGVGGCPPGLAKKNNGCMPPGQAKKLYRGQHFRAQLWRPLRLTAKFPMTCASRYDLDPRDRYYYGNGNLYQVDPRTMLVQQVISALLR